MKIFLISFIIFPLMAFADNIRTLPRLASITTAEIESQNNSIEISNLKVRCKEDHSTYYFDLHNNSEFTDYLMKIEIIKPFQQDLKIHKTVIDKNIVKIINLSQVALPAKTTIKFFSNRIFALGKSSQNCLKTDLTLKFIYKIQRSKSYNLSGNYD